MKMIGYKAIDDSTVIEYFDDGSKMKVKRFDGLRVALVGDQKNVKESKL